jgi:ribosomal protein L37AE/L43A
MKTQSKKAQQIARLEALHSEARAIVATGKCPTCGRGLKANLAITGWWMCEQRGAVEFRKHADQPSCDFQTFTQ